MKIKSLINWKLFSLLLVAGILGTLAVLPFVLVLQGEMLKNLSIPLPTIIALSTVQNAVLLSIAIFIGLFLGQKVGLGAPIVQDWLAQQPLKKKLKVLALSSAKWGVLTGLLIIGFDYIFSLFIPPIKIASPAIWKGFLASFYGGITEEIFLRLFLMTVLVWITSKFWKTQQGKPTNQGVWIAIILSAIIFGLGHLPATSLLITLTPLIIVRAILLNGIGGVIFGWLYWKKGLESAMIAHFSADIVLHVVYPLLI